MTPEQAASAVRSVLVAGPATRAQIAQVVGITEEDACCGLVRLDALQQVVMIPRRRWKMPVPLIANTRSQIVKHEIQIAAHEDVIRALREPGSVDDELVQRALATIDAYRVCPDGQRQDRAR